MADVSSSSSNVADKRDTCPGVTSLDKEALRHELQKQGADWYNLITSRCPHLFAYSPIFISEEQLNQMQVVISAVEEVVRLPGWDDTPARDDCLGVFYGYDFHLNSEGVHLIEINTNAGGAFLNALLVNSQREAGLSGRATAANDLERIMVEMFRNEWRLVHGETPLQSIAIVDELPEEQYLYPEFLLAKNIFEKAGMQVCIVDPSELIAHDNKLYFGEQKIDLIYNRLTDFSLQFCPHIRKAWEGRQVVLTPNPAHYRLYAEKNKLTLLSDGGFLHGAGASPLTIEVLLKGVPETKRVNVKDAEQWWTERKQWFFKPVNGYGSKGTYRGANLTRRVFGEIMQANYVAQHMVPPGVCIVEESGAEPLTLKFDVRCYVYDGKIQLLAARLYQGQMTNSRTPGGGFALVRLLE